MERIAENKRTWYCENIERHRKNMKAWVEHNKDYVKQHRTEYWQQNKDRDDIKEARLRDRLENHELFREKIGRVVIYQEYVQFVVVN